MAADIPLSDACRLRSAQTGGGVTRRWLVAAEKKGGPREERERGRKTRRGG